MYVTYMSIEIKSKKRKFPNRESNPGLVGPSVEDGESDIS